MQHRLRGWLKLKHFFLMLVLQLFLVACGQQSASTAPNSTELEATRNMAPVPPAPRMGKMALDAPGGAEQSLTELSEPARGGSSNAAKKYIALRHHLQIETPAEQMQASFDAALKHCQALSCEVLSANYNKETPYNPPSASLNARVPPRNVEIFLTGSCQEW